MSACAEVWAFPFDTLGCLSEKPWGSQWGSLVPQLGPGWLAMASHGVALLSSVWEWDEEWGFLPRSLVQV